MRRCIWCIAVALLSACGAQASTIEQPRTTIAVVASRSCGASPDTSLSGVAAVTDGGVVRVWSTEGLGEFFELPVVGDDPKSPPTEGDGTYVESVAVVPGTCAVFVGLCCEPASGLTKWFATPETEPVSLFGRLPAVSPDGARIALVGYGQLLVTSVDTPDEEGLTIALPASDGFTVVDMVWLDSDRLVLLVEGERGTQLQTVVVSEGAFRQRVLVDAKSDWSTTGVTGVALIGISRGDLLLGSISGGVNVIDRRDAATLESVGREKPFYTTYRWIRRVKSHTVFISSEGFLSAMKDGDEDPTPIGTKYFWAG